jgi:hypothetical protein
VICYKCLRLTNESLALVYGIVDGLIGLVIGLPLGGEGLGGRSSFVWVGPRLLFLYLYPLPPSDEILPENSRDCCRVMLRVAADQVE